MPPRTAAASSMKLSVDSRSGKSDAVTIRFVFRDQRAKLQPPVSEEEFSAKLNSLLYVRHEGVMYSGLGERAKFDANRLRTAAGTATMALKKIGRTRIAAHLIDWPQFSGAALEGIILASYRYEEFKEKPAPPIESVHIQVLPEDAAAAKRACERSKTIADAVNYARGIANRPGNLLDPGAVAEAAVALAEAKGLKVTVLDERKLRAGKFGGLLAVGGGSTPARGPRLIVLEYQGGKRLEAPLALVGKAITFDSGGISIKPAANMEEMIFDKCGGMAVLGAMSAIADLSPKRHIVGILACAENLPSATAYRPGDIVTAYDGQHIEIVNTDAEGRVVLADAIGYARRVCKAGAIIDLATLTGACGVALGDQAAGFWSNSEPFGAAVRASAEAAGERIWPMPLFQEHETQIKSEVGQLKNSGGRLGGACTAAAFLKAFAGETPWAHLDIAYTAHREKNEPHLARGATGFGVRTLVELAEHWGP